MDQVNTQRLEKRTVIFTNVAIFVFLVLAICSLVAYSIRIVTDNANQLDDSRSIQATTTALAQTRKQIEGVARDNAVWDDAVRAIYQDNDLQWMADTWGAPTTDYPLYNDVLVVDRDGNMIFGYSFGKPLGRSLDQVYDKSLNTLIARVAIRAKATTEIFTDSAYLRDGENLKVVAISPVLPSSSAFTVDRNHARFLVLIKDLDAEAITALGDSYVISHLHIDKEIDNNEINVPVKNPDGETIGQISWPPQMPGSKSLAKVTPNLIAALVLLLIFVGVFAAFTHYLIRSVTRDKRQAQFESTHDALSGLYNRVGVLRKLDRFLLNASRGDAKADLKNVSLVYLDLDGFKDVNDSYGHGVGDSLIRYVAARISEIAPAKALAARLGGDEFAVILTSKVGSNEAAKIAEAIHQLFKEPFPVDGRSIVVGASIGIATTEGKIITADELVRQADLAMYRAKDLGRGRTIVFEPVFDDYRIEQFALETDLGAAILEQDIDVAFQPLVDAKTSVWHGVEALARWHNKRLNRNIGPDEFIPIAERSGLIEALGLQVLKKSLIAAKKWPGLKISVNVSPAQFRNPQFPDHVREIIDEAEFDTKLLTLEITEGFFVRQPERARRVVHALKEMGISISLDDFGSGYSSIGYLRQFQFDRLKIDRSLVTALDHEANAPGVILATVALANAFNIPVTAEGIEREEQASILRLSGCDEFQGYLFGKPMVASEIGRHLDEEQESTTAQQVA
jgi:diguanylate cyclase (GGDEF)-like protein